MRKETENIIWGILDSVIINPIKKKINLSEAEDWVTVYFGGLAALLILWKVVLSECSVIMIFCIVFGSGVVINIFRKSVCVPYYSRIKNSRKRYIKEMR